MAHVSAVPRSLTNLLNTVNNSLRTKTCIPKCSKQPSAEVFLSIQLLSHSDIFLGMDLKEHDSQS
jgi:hypothetical protein